MVAFGLYLKNMGDKSKWVREITFFDAMKKLFDLLRATLLYFCSFELIWTVTVVLKIIQLPSRVPEVIQGRGGESRQRGIRVPKANRGQRGRNVQKRCFAMFCYYNFLLILAQSKHRFGTLFPSWAKGDRRSRLLWPAVLHLWINL